MTTAIEQYLRGYVCKYRAIAVIAAGEWAIAFAITWMVLWLLIQREVLLTHSVRLSALMIGGIGFVLVLARSVTRLFRRYDLVAAAIEVESSHPAFDQRLITVASQPVESAMLDQLRNEVESMAPALKNRPTPRPMLVAALALLAACLIAFAVKLDVTAFVRNSLSSSGK